jgi:hypothetical protein
MEIKEIKMSELVQDNRNLNKGTEKGKELIGKSLRQFGAGRSVLIDKNNRIIAGNKTHENAVELGMDDVIVVETDGSKLVAVKRTDIDLDTKKGREMALADNATVKVDLQWDTEQLESVAEDFDIDTEEWGVIPETIINPDDFFNSLGDGEENNKGEKIVVEIPVDMLDAKEDIRTNIEEAVRSFVGVKVR